MSEIDQLKNRINDSGEDGVKTSDIREDYEPAGDMMIHQLTESGEFISRRVTPLGCIGMDSHWRIYKSVN